MPRSSDLTLQILRVDDSILVVCTGPSGEAFALVEPVEVDGLLRAALKLHRLIDQTTASDPSSGHRKKLANEVVSFGRLLFNLVFSSSILDLLNLAIGQAIRLDVNVRIRLMIATDHLNIIPWELLHHQGAFISHLYDVVRHPFVLQPARTLREPKNGEVRVLFVGANPHDDIYVRGQVEAVSEAISVVKEQHIFHELRTPDATYTGIANAIYDGVDILHVLAHGRFDPNSDEGYLVIDGEGGRAEDRLPVKMLESFARAQPMQLAVLNACRSDQSQSYSLSNLKRLNSVAHRSLAHAMIRAGVPCVIGMSHRISKIGAEILTRRLYRGIASTAMEGTNAISNAMRQARLELFAHSDDLLPSDWFTPVLYSRFPDMSMPHVAAN